MHEEDKWQGVGTGVARHLWWTSNVMNLGYSQNAKDIRNGNLFSFYTLFLFFRLHNHKAATLMSWETDHFFHTHWPTSLADIGGHPKPTN